MALQNFSRHLEIGGIILALMEFLGVGKFIDQFVNWQVLQLRLFVGWYRGETEIRFIKSPVSNINYFFLLFFLIVSFYTYVELTIHELPVTVNYVMVFVSTFAVMYFLFLKVLLPVLEFIISCYIVLIGILNTKGILAIAGILIALTGFAISQLGGTPAPATPVQP